MIGFEKMELLFLRRMVSSNIRDLERRLEKYNRMLATCYGDDFQEKIALANSELRSMRSILSRLDDEISQTALS